MDNSAGFGDNHEMDQLSTHGLAEALWSVDNDVGVLAPGSHYNYTTHHSTLSDTYANPSSSSYLAYNPSRNSGAEDGWKVDQGLSSLQAATPSSSSPNILSFGHCNQQANQKVGLGNEPAGSTGHFVSRGTYTFSQPELGYAFSSSSAAAASAPPFSTHGENRGECSGGGGGSCGVVSRSGAVAGGGRDQAAGQDHIIAERKRREKLSQRFIALSAIVPGLKKTDKASVLGDAIKYMKQLQDRVQSLEEQAAKQTVESAVLVKKYHVPVDGNIASLDDSSEDPSPAVMDRSLPEIEVRVMDQTMLLRIHCAHRKAILVKILAEVERLGLSVLNSSVMPFFGSVLDITIIAQMEEGFSMPVKDIVRALHSAIIQLM